MNDSSHGERGVLGVLGTMATTRLELAALDIEAHVQATVISLLSAFVAVVLALIAFAFVGIAVIALFWDTHRVTAALAATGTYIAFAAVVALLARARWASRPPAFAATLHQLQLDRDAARGLNS